MIEDDLRRDDWKETPNLLGTIWLRGEYFCRIRDGKIVVFSTNDDMNPLGTTDSIEGIKPFQEKYEASVIERLENYLTAMKVVFREKYGRDYNEANK